MPGPLPETFRDTFEYEGWLRVVPSVHGRAAFASAVHRVFHQWNPRAIAVELPQELAPELVQGVERLPSLSLVHYEGSGALTSMSDEEHPPEPELREEESVEMVYVPIDPSDSLIEAVRLAREYGLPLEFVDRFVSDYRPPRQMLPDPDLAAVCGAATYAEHVSVLAPIYDRPIDRETDRERELLIAWRVGALREFGRVLLVCGLAHWPGIRAALEAHVPPQDQEEGERPVGLGLAHLHADSIYGLLGELPFVAARYETWRARDRQDAGAALETPKTSWTRRWRPERAIELLYERAERSYELHWGEEVSRPSRRAIRRFSAKLAATSGGVLPDLYDLVVAAKSCQDDDLAGEVYDLATTWPHLENPDDLPVIRLDPEQLRRHFRRVRMLRRDPTVFGRGRDPTKVFRRRREEAKGENWKKDWDRTHLGGCSYVPEDLRQLQWISYVRHQAPEYMKERQTVLREFTGSMLDGIDIRETLRNWWQSRVIVREEMRLRGSVGPVVVIYEDEPLAPDNDRARRRSAPERYPNTILWPGESHDEGDLVLYSTMPGTQLVGPGIARCEYGGFASLPQVHLGWWQDPWEILPGTGWVETKGELLLLTAALCSQETFVACISEKPPRRAIMARAERAGHPIIHISPANFTPSALKKLRVFHVLASRRTRAIARDYIEPRPRGFRA